VGRVFARSSDPLGSSYRWALLRWKFEVLHVACLRQ